MAQQSSATAFATQTETTDVVPIHDTQNHAKPRALETALADAIVIISSARRTSFPDAQGTHRHFDQSDAPTLHTLMTIESALGSDPMRRAETLSHLWNEHNFALRSARFAQAFAASAQSDEHNNIDMTDCATFAAYELYVARGEEPYRAGGVRYKLFAAAYDRSISWIRSVAHCLRFALAQDVGLDHTAMEVDEALLEDVATRLAFRAMGEASVETERARRQRRDATSSSDDTMPLFSMAQLSTVETIETKCPNRMDARNMESLLRKHAAPDQTLADNALCLDQASLQWLVEICSMPNPAEFDYSRLMHASCIESLKRVTNGVTRAPELSKEIDSFVNKKTIYEAIEELQSILAEPTPTRASGCYCWSKRFGAIIRPLAQSALYRLNQSIHGESTHDFGKVPFFSSVRTSRSDHTVVKLPKSTHCLLSRQYWITTGLRSKHSLERVGLCYRKALSTVIIHSLWELIGRFDEFKPMRMHSTLVRQVLDASKRETIFVVDIITAEIVHSGCYISKVIESVRNELLNPFGELQWFISAASYALRHFSDQDIISFLDNRDGASLRVLSDRLMQQVVQQIGVRPIRCDALSTHFMKTTGLIPKDAMLCEPRSRLDTAFLDRVYHPSFPFDILGVVIPAVLLFRNHHVPHITMGSFGAEWRRLSSALGLIPSGQQWLRTLRSFQAESMLGNASESTQSRRDRRSKLACFMGAELRIPHKEALMLPPDVTAFLQSRMMSTLAAPRVSWRHCRISDAGSGTTRRGMALCIHPVHLAVN